MEAKVRLFSDLKTQALPIEDFQVGEWQYKCGHLGRVLWPQIKRLVWSRRNTGSRKSSQNVHANVQE